MNTFATNLLKFRNKLKNFNKAEQNVLAFSDNIPPVWTPRAYKNLANEGYKKNVIAYRAINLISKGLASVPLKLFNLETELNNNEHVIANLLAHPNSSQTRAEFFETITGHLLMSGNAYVYLHYESNEFPLAIYTLRPDRVKVKADKSGKITGYDYGQNEYIPCREEKTGKKQILHLKFFNPLDDFYGLSPIEAAAIAIDQYNAVSSHNLSLLQNGGRPSGCLILKNKEFMTEQQKQTLRTSIKKSYEGALNAGKTMVLEGDFEWKEMGLSPKDLDFVTGKTFSAREISQAFGVPPMLVGVPGDSTFSNYREARYHLWEDTILPLLDYILGQLNGTLIDTENPDGLAINYNEDEIYALSLKRDGVWKRISEAEFLTINEKRQALGFVPIEGGDEIRRDK
ncbi:MAG: phage portal protein [Holosporales bacterium]|jgi:HK97 family phage portal protein|nr:phage portal protein [Holosporales bacterium]